MIVVGIWIGAVLVLFGLAVATNLAQFIGLDDDDEDEDDDEDDDYWRDYTKSGRHV